ncbi:hypothetical protein LOTGIDRAFT_193123 [Lottia gigantea]|uniref:Uncharacterized protein n=1 Tax=Lottia gigantea TaxID=225164 RepID=V4A1P3_LOTGI|nr:hypothetical protein LOTGIDRAFT_193123 [Lottia gigantea]ESO88825.1 hypothetical protein LOTGIDRAFT_193123 [Lottia gigantea]
MAAHGEKDITAHDKAILSQIFNPNLPFSESNDEYDTASIIDIEPQSTLEVKEAKELEVKGVKEAEEENYDEALKYLNQAVNKAPSWASTYNNRAQVYRLMGQNDEALEDLSKAITLSCGRGQAAKQAYTQRALLRKLAGNDEDSMTDFKKAAELGNEFAKQQVVSANPYAAMCNAMLSEVIHKICSGEQSCL